MPKNTDGQRRAQLLTDAIAERKALRAWERKGSDPETRPDTPAMDEIDSVQHMPKTERKARKGEGRKPSQNQQAVRDAFLSGQITHPATNGEIADVVGQPRSSVFHCVNRLVASGEATIVSSSPQRVWLTAAGKPGAVPERETTQRTRKIHTVKGNGKTVHAATAHRGASGTEFKALCSTPATLMGKVNGEVTCKRCSKALAA